MYDVDGGVFSAIEFGSVVDVTVDDIVELFKFPFVQLSVNSQHEKDVSAGGCRGCAPPPPEMTCGFLIQLVFCKKTMWFIGVEGEQETSAPPPTKNPGSAPDTSSLSL